MERKGQLNEALTFLRQALKIEVLLNNQQHLADTHLNMCAILSQLNKHQESLEHVLLATTILQEEFNKFGADEASNSQAPQSKEKSSKDDKPPNENSKENLPSKEGDVKKDTSKEDMKKDGSAKDEMKDDSKGLKKIDIANVLAIAYHNLGVELEFLERVC